MGVFFWKIFWPKKLIFVKTLKRPFLRNKIQQLVLVNLEDCRIIFFHFRSRFFIWHENHVLHFKSNLLRVRRLYCIFMLLLWALNQPSSDKEKWCDSPSPSSHIENRNLHKIAGLVIFTQTGRSPVENYHLAKYSCPNFYISKVNEWNEICELWTRLG